MNEDNAEEYLIDVSSILPPAFKTKGSLEQSEKVNSLAYVGMLEKEWGYSKLCKIYVLILFADQNYYYYCLPHCCE